MEREGGRGGGRRGGGCERIAVGKYGLRSLLPFSFHRREKEVGRRRKPKKFMDITNCFLEPFNLDANATRDMSRYSLVLVESEIILVRILFPCNLS